MRKLYLTIFGLTLIPFLSWSQSVWQTTGNDIYYNGGNVGIGTSQPQQKLDVNGTIQTSGNIKIESSSPRLNLYSTASGQRNYTLVNAGDYLQFQLRDGDVWSATPLRIKNTGDIDVFASGLSNNKMFNVNGNMTIKKLTVKNDIINQGYHPFLRFSNTGYRPFNVVSADGKLKFEVLNTNNSYDFTPMTINENGDITMGDNGQCMKLTVHGTIKAEEVTVTGVGCDYVFEDDYDLMPINNVRDYIKKHKHLPNIPPASETEKGVELGDFSEILLSKIEELTLYTIEQDQRIEKLRAEQNQIVEMLKGKKK